MLHKIQSQLVKEHPELQQKQQIFEFYVSLESPEKQRKLINWWQQIIEAAIRQSEDIYLTPADLEVIFTLHGLKPVPLEKVLDYLSKTNRIEWVGRASSQQKENMKGWLGSIMSVVWRPKTDVGKSGFKSMASQQQQKIISARYKKQIVNKIKSAINKQTLQDNVISFEYVLSRLKHEVSISVNSIEYLLSELQNDGFLLIDLVQDMKVIIHANQESDIKNDLWVEIEKNKFLLKSTIEQFDRKIGSRLKEEEAKLTQAKKCVEVDQARAKKILREVRTAKNLTDEYENRRKLLQQTYNRLEIQMINSATVNLVSECQRVVEKSMIDVSQMEAIKEKHIEIGLYQKQMDAELGAMTSRELEEEVDSMMADLEKQLKQQKVVRLGSQKDNKKNTLSQLPDTN